MRLFLLLCSLLFTGSLIAQSFTGVWGGKRTQVTGGCFPEYNLELHITWFNNNSFLGNAYNFIDQKQFTKINFTGRYNPQTRRMVIIENAVLQYTVPGTCVPCIKTYDLTWSKNGNEESLLGDWKGHEMGNTNNCLPGNITLTRKLQPTFPVDVYQNDTLLALQKSLKLKSREKETVQTLVVDSPSIKIELYDDGVIDDDTVTLLLNNTLLLYKKRLSDKALTLNITAFPNTEYELMMYADNLGSIPPNTALMVITAGKKRYELRLSSSEQKTATVRFKLE